MCCIHELEVPQTVAEIRLVLKDAKRALDDNVLEDRSGRDVNGIVLSGNDDDGT
jgi:hypothetical protein